MNKLKLLKYKEKFETLMVYLEDGAYLDEAPVDEVIERLQEYLVAKIRADKPASDDLKVVVGGLEWVLDKLEEDLLDDI